MTSPASSRELDLALARDLAHDLARDLDREFDVALALDRAVALACGPALDAADELDVANDLERARDRARNLAARLGRGDFEFVIEVANTMEVDRDLAFDLASALDDAKELAHAVVITRDLGRNRALANELRSAIDLLVSFEKALALTSARTAAEPAARSSVRVSRLASRATTLAAGLTPRASRARYIEEYAAELYELAQFSRRAQWAYAARLLLCAPSLRYVLRHDARGAVQGP